MKKKINKMIDAILRSENAEEFSKFFDVEDFDLVEEVWENCKTLKEDCYCFCSVDSFFQSALTFIKVALAYAHWKIDEEINEERLYDLYDINNIAADILIGAYKLGLISGDDILSYRNEVRVVTA